MCVGGGGGINGGMLAQLGVEWGRGIWVFFITSLFSLGVCVCACVHLHVCAHTHYLHTYVCLCRESG